jgi:hypothetical protein
MDPYRLQNHMHLETVNKNSKISHTNTVQSVSTINNINNIYLLRSLTVAEIKILFYKIKGIGKKKSFRVGLNNFISLDKLFILDGRWLKTLIP